MYAWCMQTVCPCSVPPALKNSDKLSAAHAMHNKAVHNQAVQCTIKCLCYKGNSSAKCETQQVVVQMDYSPGAAVTNPDI